MRFKNRSRWVAPPVLMAAAALLILEWGVGVNPARAQGEPQKKAKSTGAGAGTGADPRAQDLADLRAMMQSFVKAFEAGDAHAVAESWTAEGEYVSEDGGTVRGREALEKAFTAAFANRPKVHVETRPEAPRFVSRDSAIAEGTVTIRKESSESPVVAHYRILFVREDGRWRMAQLSESTVDEPSLEELAWLVGDWKSSGEETEVKTTYSWNQGKTFLKVHFTIQEKDRSLSGDQFLGRDPATGAIRAWTFESGGGLGEGTWNQDGDHWVVESAGTMADGSTLTATNILTKINQDTFTWQSIDRMLGEVSLPDLAPVKVTRIKSEVQDPANSPKGPLSPKSSAPGGTP